MSARDPELQSLFAAADQPLEDTDFNLNVMARVAHAERRRLWRRGLIAAVFVLALWVLSVEALPFFLTQSFIDPGNFGVADHWVAEALSPLNSIAGVLTLLLLGLRAFYRRLRG
ncbi:MAG: hypothetical protein ACPG06_08465 [Alphaproteobacteria bacterium]